MDIVSQTYVRVRIEDLAKNAKKELWLITPYIDLWDHLERAILDAKVRGVKVIVITRGGHGEEKRREATTRLREFKIPVLFLERLHAKIYISESVAILSSMNLLKSSQESSWEVAAVFSRRAEPADYQKVAHAANEIVLAMRAEHDRNVARKVGTPASPAGGKAKDYSPSAVAERARAEQATQSKKAKGSTRAKKAQSGSRSSKLGVCIRCSDTIRFNPDKPLCATCYKTWSKFADENYVEKYCHGCGKSRKTSLARPLCRPCWKKAG